MKNFFIYTLCLFMMVSRAFALETDQLTNRHVYLHDSLTILDDYINKSLEKVAQEWNPAAGENEKLFIEKVYRQISGSPFFSFFASYFELWIHLNPKVDKLYVKDHIYKGAFLQGSKLLRLTPLAPTVLVGGIRLGTDKLAHFFSEGYNIYHLVQHYKSEEKALDIIRLQESTYYGRLISGTFSNADLVANYEGYLFYKDLFHGNKTLNKSPILNWQNKKPVIQRKFTWLDYVNDFWDEVLLPNTYNEKLRSFIIDKMKNLCAEYFKNEYSYESPNSQELLKRYKILRIDYNQAQLMKNVCTY